MNKGELSKNDFESNYRDYHNMLNALANQVWDKKSNQAILDLFYLPRDSFFEFCKDNNLNYGSIAGIIQEWALFHLIKTGVERYSTKKDVEVLNGWPIPFKWKTKGHSKVNLDVVIKNKNSTKLYFAFEMKTNFEDGFPKYLREEASLFHHRQKTFSPFRYFYISLTPPTTKIRVNHKQKLNTLQRRKELYILSKEDTKGYPGPIDFLQNLEKLLKEI